MATVVWPWMVGSSTDVLTGSELDREPGLNDSNLEILKDLTLVTGATGFIGSRLAIELARSGARVRVLVRGGTFATPPDVPTCPLERIEVVSGDITQIDSLQQAMRGCRYVYHLAAYAKNWAAQPETYDKVNVEGLRNVLDVAAAEQVDKVLWTSTVVTLEPSRPGEVGDESIPRRTPYFTHYERTKAAGEELAVQYAAKGVPVVIANPARVYGPGHLTESNALVKILDLYDRGLAPFMLGAGKPRGNYVFIDDAVKGLMLTMHHGRPGRRYLIGGENASFREFFDTIDRVSGKRHLRIPVRRPGAFAFAYFHQLRAQWFGVYPEMTPPWVRLFLKDWAYSTRRAEEELGYKYISLEEGIRRTYEWLVQIRESQKR